MKRSLVPILCWLALVLISAKLQGIQLPEGIARSQAASDDWETNCRDGLSYLEHILVNGESQDSGDCLIRVRNSFDSVFMNSNEPRLMGAVIERVELIRFRFDYKNQRFLLAKLVTEDRLELGLVDPNTKKPISKVTHFPPIAWAIDFSKNISTVTGSGRVHSLALEKWGTTRDDILKRFNPLDFRAFGITYTYDYGEFEKYRDSLKQAEAGHEVFETKNLGNEFRVTRYYGPKKSEARIYTNYWLDSKSMFPTKFKSFMKDEVTGAFDQFSDEVKEMEWTEKNGIYLPQFVVTHGAQQELVRNNELEWGANVKSMDFHWISINSSFKENEFDGAALFKSAEAIRELVDPKANGAKKILIKMENESIKIN